MAGITIQYLVFDPCNPEGELIPDKVSRYYPRRDTSSSGDRKRKRELEDLVAGQRIFRDWREDVEVAGLKDFQQVFNDWK